MAIHPQTLSIATRLIEEFEGIELEAYLDPVGIPTICAGLTRYPNGEPVRMGDVCDYRICKRHLEELLRKQYIPAAECIPGWDRLGPNRQAVLLSFAWNLGARFYGAAGFETISGVLRDGAVRAEVYQQMPQALALYVKAGGRTLDGLVNRRRREAAIWQQEDDGTMKFIAQQNTLLKKAPIDGHYLSEAGKKPVAKGELVAITKLDEIPGDSHAWVSLLGSGERWAIFMPHWLEEQAKPAPSHVKQVNWNDFACPIGKYITVGEVLQYDARRRPKAGSSEEKAIIEICRQFDAIREAWAGPLGVTSGYRPEPINSQVGGVSGSYHVKGMALDIYPIGDSLQKFHQWLVQRWSGGYGDGRPKGFIHIDTRSGGKFHARGGVRPAAIWDY
jgi:GH24 family phage-related lysozyme (muramidase)